MQSNYKMILTDLDGLNTVILLLFFFEENHEVTTLVNETVPSTDDTVSSANTLQ